MGNLPSLDTRGSSGRVRVKRNKLDPAQEGMPLLGRAQITVGIGFVGHAVLTDLLLDVLTCSAPARVVVALWRTWEWWTGTTSGAFPPRSWW